MRSAAATNGRLGQMEILVHRYALGSGFVNVICREQYQVMLLRLPKYQYRIEAFAVLIPAVHG
jgi:hypothetical protein